MNPRSIKNAFVGLLVAALIGGISYWLAVERPRRVEEVRVAKQARIDDWVQEQKELLTSGAQQHVYFYSTSNTDDLIAEFSGMPEIENLGFELADLSNDGFRHVAELPNLQQLMLYGGYQRIGDSGLEMLRDNQTLRKLKLVNIDVTDAGLDVLPSLPMLTELELFRESFREVTLTDSALEHLRKLHQLEELTISGGWMSNPAFKELRDALPNCEINAESKH